MLEVLACAVMALWLQSCSITPCLCTLQWYNLYSTLVLHCLSASDFSTRALNCNDFTPFPTSETLNHHKNVIFHSYRKFISLKISVSGGGGGGYCRKHWCGEQVSGAVGSTAPRWKMLIPEEWIESMGHLDTSAERRTWNKSHNWQEGLLRFLHYSRV